MPEILFITEPLVISCYHFPTCTTLLRKENFITSKTIWVFSDNVLLSSKFHVAFKAAKVFEMPVTALCLSIRLAKNELKEKKQHGDSLLRE
jgi:hypothetical protein